MGSGFVINGKAELLDGLVVQNYLDNPHLRLAPDDVRRRAASEHICAVVLHTTKGIPGGRDHRPQVIHPGIGSSSRAGERIVGSWTLDSDVHAGAHLIVDFDGRVYCCADLARQAAYHAGPANGASIGIEMMQGSDAGLYAGQLEVVVSMVEVLCARFGVARRIPLPYTDHPVPALDGQHLDGISGVFGHRDLTSTRGRGDPGDAIMDLLAAAGFELHNFSR